MKALIDYDLVAYRTAASANNDSLDIAILRCDKLVRELLEKTHADTYRGFLSGDNNFRKSLDPLYKANRVADKPIWLEQCKEYLVTEWKAEISDGCEADDLLGVYQVKDFHNVNDPREETVIVSLDKDMLMIPGRHYRWEISGNVKGKVWTKPAEDLNVSYFDGLLSFYTSSLVGDATDNIIGVRGVGPKKAKEALGHLQSEQELFDRCRELYSDDDRYFKNLSLLWIWQKFDDVFNAKERGLI
jgi:5'-3' exonuclease